MVKRVMSRWTMFAQRNSSIFVFFQHPAGSAIRIASIFFTSFVNVLISSFSLLINWACKKSNKKSNHHIEVWFIYTLRWVMRLTWEILALLIAASFLSNSAFNSSCSADSNLLLSRLSLSVSILNKYFNKTFYDYS